MDRRLTPLSAAMGAIEAARAGRFSEIRERFAPVLRPMVPTEVLEAAWSREISRHGPVVALGTPVTERGPGGVVVKVPVTFAQGQLTIVVSATEDGWLTGIQLLPASAAGPAVAWEPPPYANPAAFDEREVTVGTGPLAVPGTLSLPRHPGQRPGIVLLAGSGPQDRDGTIWGNKPLKDLAWGLASQGIAVLRFDKVTLVHASQVAADREFTVDREYVQHAVAAVALLRSHPEIDPARIYVAGHSLGGTIAPRVAEADPSVAGLIILAGGTQPLHWAAVRQFRYLASIDPDAAPAFQPAVEEMARRAENVDSLDAASVTPADELPFGVPAHYWLDLRGYDPAATAARLRRPVLILQGGRDYQVTVADDLAGWREGLAGLPNVTFLVHEADDHLFFSGSGPSTPERYQLPQHVDPTVVADIVRWVEGPGSGRRSRPGGLGGSPPGAEQPDDSGPSA